MTASAVIQPTEVDVDAFADVFAALAEPVRVQIPAGLPNSGRCAREPGLLGVCVGVAAALRFGAYWLNRLLWDDAVFDADVTEPCC